MTNIEKIIEEFHRKFIENKREDGEDFTLYLRDNAIKSFLQSALNQIRQETLEEIEEEVSEKKKYTASGTKEREMIYNSAISDIVNLIQSKKENI